MPLTKTKKDKSNKKGRTPVMDRFMIKALNAKFPQAKSNDILEHEFTEVFSEKRLKIIGAATDRVLLGRGKFDKLYQKAKQLSRDYAKHIDQAPLDHEGNATLDQNHIDELITGFGELENLAVTWLQSDEAKWERKGEDRKDATTRIKESEARGMLQSARTTIFQLKNLQKLRSPAIQKIVNKLEELKDTAGNGKPKDVENYRSLDATLLNTLCGDSRPESGTSDVKLIKGPDGGVAYAFKSIEGESEQMGTPKGYGTSREVLMSEFIEKINEQTTLNLGWPKVSMAKVGDKSGALIDGVKGKGIGPGGISPKDLSPKTLQKILLSNLCAGQFDIKWEDVRLVEDGDTEEPVCMDGGASFLDPNLAVQMLYGQATPNPGEQLITDPESHNDVLPSAKEDLSPEMVQEILSIDTKALKSEMNKTAKRLESDHGLSTKALGLDGGIDTSMRSIEALQKIIKEANGKVSLEVLLKKYHKDFVEEQLVNPGLAKWEQDQRDKYQVFIKDYTGVFPPYETLKDKPREIFIGFLHPQWQPGLKLLNELARKQSATVLELLKSLNVPVPCMGVNSAFKAAKKAADEIASNYKNYTILQQTYPGVLQDLDKYDPRIDAYTNVILKDYMLRATQVLADKVAKHEGRDSLSLFDFLVRNKIPLPLNNLKGLDDKVANDPTLIEIKEKELKEKELKGKK